MQKKFSENDSGISFILALLCPSILAIFVLIIVGSIVGVSTLENTTFYKIFSSLLNQVVFIIIYLIISRQKKVGFKPLANKKLTFKEILIVLLIAISCLFLITPLMNVYDEFLMSIGINETASSITLNSIQDLLFYIFALGILAPISEELLFRGVILNGLEERGTKNAVLLSSLMFMLMHLNIHQTIYQFILGIILALVVLYTKNIFAGILIHLFNNTSILLINYISPQFFDCRYLSLNFIVIALSCFLIGGIIIIKLLELLKKQGEKQKPFYEFEKVEEKGKALKISIILSVVLWLLTFIMGL